MLNRLKAYLYKAGLKIRGAKLQYPIRGYDFLFGNVKGLTNGMHIMLESGVKLNIGNEASLVLGDYVYINSYSIIDCQYKISIGKRVQIGPNCYIGDFDHSLHVDVTQVHHREGKQMAAVVISENVWIGAGAIILKGVTVGKNSVIAAGSVVTRDIPPNVVAAGVPALVIKNIDNNHDEDALPL
jgi:acetyltransferase-like isoleucine patch superfamily enzyme